MERQHIDTTSEIIKKWRGETSTRLASSSGFAEALESASAAQRQSEDAWLSDAAFSEYAAIHRANRAVPASGKSEEPAALRAVLRSAHVVAGDDRFRDGNAWRAAYRLSKGVAAAPCLASLSALDVYLAAFASAAPGDAQRFTLKVPSGNQTTSFNDMRHEAMVCIFGTNSLRSEIPNFPLAYAALVDGTCEVAAQKPFSPRRKRGYSARGPTLPSSASFTGLIFEHIDADTTTPVSDLLASGALSPEEFYQLVAQIVQALRHASEAISFTHYDLNTRNVLATRIADADSDAPPVIAYDGGRVMVPARYLARIVDFGFSHVSVPNSEGRSVSFGFAADGLADLVELGIFRDRANPMTDIYRFLLTAAVDDALAPGKPLSGAIASMMTYFNQTETLVEIIEAQRENFFCLPLTTHTRAYNYDDFFVHVKRAAKADGGVVVARTPASMSKPGGSRAWRDPVATGDVVSGADPASLSTPPPSVYPPPSTFSAFFDRYSALVASIDTPGDAETARTFTAAFSKGFSEGRSLFNAAISHSMRTVVAARDAARGAGTNEYAVARAEYTARYIETEYRAMMFTIRSYWPDVAQIPANVAEHINTYVQIAREAAK